MITSEELKRAFAEAEQEIQNYAAETPKYNSLLAYKNRITKLSTKTLNGLKAKISAYKTETIEDMFYEKVDEVANNLIQQYEDAGVDVPDLKDAAGDLVITNAQVNCEVYLLTAVNEAEANMQQLIDEAVQDVEDARAAQEKLSMSIANGIACGQAYSNGTLLNLMLSAYGNTAINGIENDILNSTTLAYASTNGYDLVQISLHFGACPICIPYEGRVYTQSGNDSRFPYLYDTPWSDAFQNLHPNCRHQLLIYVEDLQELSYRNEMLRFSNRSFELFGRDWSQKDIEYAKKSLSYYRARQQRIQRLNADRDQYERYKARLGDKAPKTFAAFRRIKLAGGEAWERLQQMYRDVGKGLPAVPRPVKSKIVKPKTEQKKYSAMVTDIKKRDASIKPDGEYEKLLNAKYNSGTEIGKLAYRKFIPSEGGVCVESDTSGNRAWCTVNGTNSTVHLNFNDDHLNPMRLGETWYHEHGHYIDQFNDAIGSEYAPTDWGKAFQKQIIDEVKAHERLVKKEKGLDHIIDARRLIGAELYSGGKDTIGVQDLFGGAAKTGYYPRGLFSTCWGHSKSYYADSWKNTGVAKEAFAEMFEAQFDNGTRAAFKKWLPKSTEMFEKKLTELTK